MKQYRQVVTLTVDESHACSLRVMIRDGLALYAGQGFDIETASPASLIGEAREILRQLDQASLGNKNPSQTMVTWEMSKVRS